MLATATVVEIENRFIGQRFKVILPMPRPRLIARLKKHLTAVDPQSGETLSSENDPLGCSPLEACVFIDPRGRIRVLIYATDATGTAATRGELDSGRMMEANFRALEEIDERHLVDILADNLRRLMDRESITVETLAARAGIDPARLAEILDKQGPGAFLNEVCNLAESLDTTVEALMGWPNDQEAEGWN